MASNVQVTEVRHASPSEQTVIENDVEKLVKIFSLKLNDVAVEVCSIGASVTKLLLPNKEHDKNETMSYDDIVLGYKNPVEMHHSGNPNYLGVVVGRVANRIAKGQFRVRNTDYRLAINNSPNHLHGGNVGFSKRIWDMEIVNVPAVSECEEEAGSSGAGKTTQNGIKCTLLSPDGDQGYPGSILITVVYTLEANLSGNGVSFNVNMKAQLQDDKPTPINLAQHSYFNLAKHNNPYGILDHKLTLCCDSYTPTDTTSIPTRQVVSLKDDPPMDLSSPILMRDALKIFGMSKAGIDEDEASKHVLESSRCGPAIAKYSPNSKRTGEPYGFDHNYIVKNNDDPSTNLSLVGIIEHEETMRRMKVYTNAPGVQVYTGNNLDGANPSSTASKDGAIYGQWQGICLETQHFPDSILSEEDETSFPDFSKGKCTILRPGGPDYTHDVRYSFENLY